MKEDNMKWISIENKLPKYTQTYVVACNIITSYSPMYREVRAYRYEAWHNKWVLPKDCFEMVEITHWMSLPNLPEEGLKND